MEAVIPRSMRNYLSFARQVAKSFAFFLSLSFSLFFMKDKSSPASIFLRRLILYYVGADETTGVEQQSHHAQPDVREARTEALTPEAKENRDPGLDFGIAQMPRRLPTQEMHPFKRLPGWRRCHVAEDRRQKPTASRLAGESRFNFNSVSLIISFYQN